MARLKPGAKPVPRSSRALQLEGILNSSRAKKNLRRLENHKAYLRAKGNKR